MTNIFPEQNGPLDGICVVGLDLGQLLCAAGQRERGIEILTRSSDGFARLFTLNSSL